MKLKRCPFCNGKAELDSPKKYGNGRSAYCSVVRCTKCGVQGRPSWPWTKSEYYEYKPRATQDKEVVDNWNKRSF